MKMDDKANAHRLEKLGQNNRNYKLNEYTGTYIRFLSGFSERIVLIDSIYKAIIMELLFNVASSHIFESLA